MTSNANSPSRKVNAISRSSLPGRVVLVMQGGGAPGCYQAGAYQALHEAGIEPDWVIGTSIGAINGAIISGNNVSDRVEKLRDFWARLGQGFPGQLPQMALLTGVPGFCYPNPALIWGADARVGIERASLYLSDPLKRLLPSFVDFDLINSGHTRFTLGLATVETGQIRYFDSQREKIGVEHVLGSSAVPPSFPAVLVDGEYYWDGGVYSNSPIEVVFDEYPRRSSVVFAVQIWHTHSPHPQTLSHAFMRLKDIIFGSRSRTHIMRQAELHRLRRVIHELVDMLPEETRATPRVKDLAGWGCTTTMHLVEINAQPIEGETDARDFDFSRASVEARWQAGYADTCRMLESRPWEDPIDPATAVTVYSSDSMT